MPINITMIITKERHFKPTDILPSQKRGLFIFQTLKNRAIHILFEVKKGIIRTAYPYYTIYREIAPRAKRMPKWFHWHFHTVETPERFFK